MRVFLMIILVGGIVSAAVQAEGQGRRPDIIFINADDFGFQLGCCGDENARTPELDRFAGENVLFTQACVAQASCSPSRSSVMTGLYPHQSGQIGLAHLGYRMRRDIVESLPRLLAKNGYRCGVIGKLHVAPFDAFEFSFSRFSDYKPRPGAGENDAAHVATRDKKRVEEAVSEFVTGTKPPFFLYVNLFDPHEPFLSQANGLPEDPVTASRLKPLFGTMGGDPDLVAGYYNGVARMDAIFGGIRDVLTQQGCWENSLVVFWGDNGQPFPGAKATASEGGLKVPLIVHWPESGSGRRVEEPVSVLDLFRTALDAAGISSPAFAQGSSLLPCLRSGGDPDRMVFAERNAHGVSDYHPERVVYRGGLKGVVDFTRSPALAALDGKQLRGLGDPGSLRLFDLRKDPAEKHNLAGDPEYREEVRAMLGALEDWMRSTGDFLCDPRIREELRAAQAAAFSTGGTFAQMPLASEQFTKAVPASGSIEQ